MYARIVRHNSAIRKEAKMAAYNGDVDKIEKLYQTNPNIFNTLDVAGSNLLQLAATAGHLAFVKSVVSLLSRQHEEQLNKLIKHVNLRGESVLDCAYFSGHVSVDIINSKVAIAELLRGHDAVAHKNEYPLKADSEFLERSGAEVLELLATVNKKVSTIEFKQVTELRRD